MEDSTNKLTKLEAEKLAMFKNIKTLREETKNLHDMLAMHSTYADSEIKKFAISKQAEVDMLREEINFRGFRINELQGYLHFNDGKINSLNAFLVDYSAKLVESQSASEKAIKKCKELEAHINILQSLLSSKEGRLSCLQRELEERRKENKPSLTSFKEKVHTYADLQYKMEEQPYEKNATNRPRQHAVVSEVHHPQNYFSLIKSDQLLPANENDIKTDDKKNRFGGNNQIEEGNQIKPNDLIDEEDEIIEVVDPI